MSINKLEPIRTEPLFNKITSFDFCGDDSKTQMATILSMPGCGIYIHHSERKEILYYGIVSTFFSMYIGINQFTVQIWRQTTFAVGFPT